MKKKFLLCVSLLLATSFAKAQTVIESNLLDNWFIGIDGGAYLKTTHSDKFGDTRAMMGIKAGRYITPVFGLRGDAQFYLNEPGAFKSKTAFNLGNVSLDGLFNFNNLFSKYNGTPRTFEYVGVLGLGWCHGFGLSDNIDRLSTKVGMQFNYNFGSDKQWQINLEPDMVYLTDGDHGCNVWNVNKSGMQLTAGVTYKFKCSNKTHNFVIAEDLCKDQIDALNAKINAQRNEIDSKDGIIANNNNEIADLKKQLNDCQSSKGNVNSSVDQLMPVVIFDQGKSTIKSQQVANVHLIADYLVKNAQANITIKGYASPEGKASYNQALSVKRGNAVKNMLVNDFGIDADRISVEGYGASEKVFDKSNLNRVCIFVNK